MRRFRTAVVIIHGFTGNLTATVENLGQVVEDIPIIWKSSDTSVDVCYGYSLLTLCPG